MFLPLAGLAQKPKGDDKPVLYLPTAVGEKRVLESTWKGRSTETTVWVTAVETKGGMTVVSLAREEGGPTMVQYGASADGVFLVSMGKLVQDPPHRLLKLPPKEGETWESEFTAPPGIQAPKFKFTTGKEEEVEVPAGKFKAVRVEEERTSPVRVNRTTYWHAPGVGIVKIVNYDVGAEGDSIDMLKSVTPGAKK
jgi:hypothetical protein